MPQSVDRSITGAILLGGRSLRMGTPKHELVLADGRTMLEHVRDSLAKVCREVVLVDAAGSQHACIGRIIKDQRAGHGPLAGIESLLASGIDSEYLVSPCDMPLMSPAALRLLSSGLNDKLATVLRLQNRAEPESMPLRISAAALPTVRTLLDSGQRAIRALLQELSAESVTVPAAWEKCFANVNSPTDFALLQE